VDRQFESVDDYATAHTKGYFNPTNESISPYSTYTGSMPVPDPLAGVSTTYHNNLKSQLINYQGKGVSMWALALSTWAMTARFDGHYVYRDLDMAWRSFRQLYLDAKRKLVDDQLKDSCSGATATTLLAAGHQPHFTDGSELPGMNISIPSNMADVDTLQAHAQDSLVSAYAANCHAYATYWLQQLARCSHYPADSINNVIIPRLEQVCREGSDNDHPLGASSVNLRALTYSELLKM